MMRIDVQALSPGHALALLCAGLHQAQLLLWEPVLLQHAVHLHMRSTLIRPALVHLHMGGTDPR